LPHHTGSGSGRFFKLQHIQSPLLALWVDTSRTGGGSW